MNIEELVSRICAGFISWGRFRLDSPSIQQRYISTQIYNEWYLRGIKIGLPEECELQDILFDEGIWFPEDDSQLKVIYEDIDKLKVALFQSVLRSADLPNIRAGILRSKFRAQQLEKRKHSLDYLTAEFMGKMAKNNYLAMCGVFDGEKIIDPEEAIRYGHPSFQDIIDVRNSMVLEDWEFRLIARSDFWQSIWIGNKASNSLFGRSSIELTGDQQNLIRWSTLYDNIREHTECPSDEVVQDDDMLDGWLILQHRERLQAKNASQLEKSKFGNAGEVFIPVSTPDDAKKVYGANSATSERTRRERLNAVNKFGVVEEAQMPDSKREIMMQMNRMAMERGKRG